jgi:hypothetical protein
MCFTARSILALIEVMRGNLAMNSSSNGGSGNGHPVAPKNLAKMKAALKKIVSVPKSEVDAALAKERQHKRTIKP